MGIWIISGRILRGSLPKVGGRTGRTRKVGRGLGESQPNARKKVGRERAPKTYLKSGGIVFEAAFAQKIPFNDGRKVGKRRFRFETPHLAVAKIGIITRECPKSQGPAQGQAATYVVATQHATAEFGFFGKKIGLVQIAKIPRLTHQDPDFPGFLELLTVGKRCYKNAQSEQESRNNFHGIY